MKKVWISPGCITCGACEFRSPDVFEVTDISHVKEPVDYAVQSEAIKEAAAACPVNVIQYEE